MYYFTLANAILLNVSGPDARRYLNARLTNDIKSLVVGEGCNAAALTPQGRTQGYFTILCLAEKEFLVLADGGNKDSVIPALKKYLVADRVTIKDLSTEYCLLHLMPSTETEDCRALLPNVSLPTRAHQHILFEDDLRIIKARRSNNSGFDIICSRNRAEKLVALFKEKIALELDASMQNILRMQAAIPAFPEDLNEDLLFSSASLQNSVSFKKGCYVGQEVIEKIDAYGKAPSLLKLIKVEGRLEAGDGPLKVFLNDASGGQKSVGKIVSSCYDNSAQVSYCFAELKNDPEVLNSELLVQNKKATVHEG